MPLTTEEKVKQIIAVQLCVDESEVVDSANLVNDLGADSLDMTELVMNLEEEFNLEIPDDDADRVLTVADAVSYVQKRV